MTQCLLCWGGGGGGARRDGVSLLTEACSAVLEEGGCHC